MSFRPESILTLTWSNSVWLRRLTVRTAPPVSALGQIVNSSFSLIFPFCRQPATKVHPSIHPSLRWSDCDVKPAAERPDDGSRGRRRRRRRRAFRGAWGNVPFPTVKTGLGRLFTASEGRGSLEDVYEADITSSEGKDDDDDGFWWKTLSLSNPTFKAAAVSCRGNADDDDARVGRIAHDSCPFLLLLVLFDVSLLSIHHVLLNVPLLTLPSSVLPSLLLLVTKL